jgi:hypothetical protein
VLGFTNGLYCLGCESSELPGSHHDGCINRVNGRLPCRLSGVSLMLRLKTRSALRHIRNAPVGQRDEVGRPAPGALTRPKPSVPRDCSPAFREGAIEARYHQIHYRKMRSFPNLPPFTFEDTAPFGCGN